MRVDFGRIALRFLSMASVAAVAGISAADPANAGDQIFDELRFGVSTSVQSGTPGKTASFRRLPLSSILSATRRRSAGSNNCCIPASISALRSARRAKPPSSSPVSPGRSISTRSSLLKPASAASSIPAISTAMMTVRNSAVASSSTNIWAPATVSTPTGCHGPDRPFLACQSLRWAERRHDTRRLAGRLQVLRIRSTISAGWPTDD